MNRPKAGSEFLFREFDWPPAVTASIINLAASIMQGWYDAARSSASNDTEAAQKYAEAYENNRRALVCSMVAVGDMSAALARGRYADWKASASDNLHH